MYKLFFKNLIDYSVSIILLVVLMPVILMILLLLYIYNSGHSLYIQERPGKDEKIFALIKFKTMNDKCDSKGKFLPPAQRITKFGRFLRSSSLDELPQLINVIKGDMSLVGPRPLRVEYLPHYNKEQSRRHNVKPGITGWAQVKGRNAITWDKKFELDVWYVDNMSFSLDVKILFMTFINVFRKEGINQSDQDTMESFMGVDLEN